MGTPCEPDSYVARSRGLGRGGDDEPSNSTPRRISNGAPRRAPQPFQQTINFVREKQEEAQNEKGETSNKCTVCETAPGHRLALCPKLIAMEPTLRAQTVFDLGNCFRCLSRNHSSHECRKADAICGIQRCNHHTSPHLTPRGG
ncbi:hypothetical protein OUZ56_017244 [Daphnia magna]|uniref:CCHC-type domain-containing protein n=1 Tax=Daphnia magna TaxID=35525 RepID=A0ABR0ASG9_9CRUS|nr:hypothetical protein OUZ56_017244 [Daphnia magna]